ncbi:hypothetical protein ACFSM5_03990 [Lacibacterium aquatile]|uniref:PAS domain-containing protein n=1 Tax=Lacibacterium aquatile TaxID=1168082 RepID=A0ABW5DQ75_9PROT
MSSFDAKAHYFFKKSTLLELEDAPEPLAAALNLWRDRRGLGALPVRRSILVTDLPLKLVGMTHLIDVEYEPDDQLQFRVRLYGTAIPVQTPERPEGRLMTEMGFGDGYEEIILSDYSDVVRSKSPCLHLYEGMLDHPDTGRPYVYNRLILPLGDEEGRVVVLMVMSRTLAG